MDVRLLSPGRVKGNWVVAFFILSVLISAFCIERTYWVAFTIATTIAGGGAYILTYKKTDASYKTIFTVAIVLRIILLFATPLWSEDIYRFLWDGELLKKGINPFYYKPSTIFLYIKDSTLSQLYTPLNSKNYFSIYPPLMQLMGVVASILGNSIYQKIVLYKLPIVMADIGVVFLLKERLKTKSIAPNYLFAYALHPLILWEFSFNGHTECVMLFFLLLALRSYQQKEYLLMGLWMGFSIATKLTTGLVFLYLLFNLDKKKRYPFLSGCLICIIILFLPYFDIKLIHHLSQSIGLYFHTFEFNAGIYFLLRESIQALVGYNPIKILGPMLSIVALSIILYICVDARNKSEISDGKIVSIFTIFYLLSTTVHPWYLCIPIAFGAIQNSKFIWWWGLLSMYSYLYYPFQSENAKLMLSLSIYAALIFIAYHEYQRKRLHAE